MMWHRATIQSRKQLSPTVTGLTLKIEQQLSEGFNNNLNFTFSPGQWVDFQPLPNNTSWKPPSDGRGTIGGYSITSIPQSLPYIDLAIQKSRHPVANWVADCADVNDMVQLRVGGSFTYTAATATSNKQRRLLFIAGGVGINPLFSMIQQWHVNQTTEKNENRVVDSTSSRAVLLYSGRCQESLLFVDELNKMVEKLSDRFRVVLTTTKTTSSSSSGVVGGTIAVSPEHGDKNMEHITFKSGRIDHGMIEDAIVWLIMAITEQKKMSSNWKEKEAKMETMKII